MVIADIVKRKRVAGFIGLVETRRGVFEWVIRTGGSRIVGIDILRESCGKLA
jgi:hypothetical protein